ncbi:GmrSD restriction endonuclease domain-containing protein [Natronospora cellulosivora (SeqCode)]
MGETIKSLLEEIKHKELVLPEFQREYTWTRTQVKDLFTSLFKDYPTGSLLIWKTDNPPKIKNDAFDLESVRRVKVLLDGQQRLTSLYLNVYGETPPFYNDTEISDGYFNLFFNLKTGEFKYYKQKEMDNNPLWYNVIKLFKDPPSVFQLVRELDVDNVDQIGNIIENNLKKIEDILDKNYPVQEVPTDSSLREAIKVFDLINSQGTPLTNADIALAYMTAEWPDMRRIFKDKIEELSQEDFTFDLTFMTRAMVGILSGRGSLKQFVNSNIEQDVSESTLKLHWKKLNKILNYLVSFLKNKAYIMGTSDLNTSNVLIPIIVYLAKNEHFNNQVENKMLYWLYAALYQRRFSSSLETSLEQDVNAVIESNNPDSLIENLKEEEGDPILTEGSLDMRGVGHPLYNMMCIVIRAKGAVDWNNGLPLGQTTGEEFKLERHHIFPRSILEDSGYDTGNNHHDKKRVNEIANRIPLTKSGNLNIFNKSPEEYLPIVERNYPGVLESSLIPLNLELWKLENYELFLEERRKIIASEINQFMRNLIS